MIKLANKIAPQRSEYRKQFTKVLTMANQQRADNAEEEKEDLLEGGAASEQLVGSYQFSPEQVDRLKKLRALPPAPTKIPVLKNTIESLSSAKSVKQQQNVIIPLVI